jgi:DNA-binding SARP family transcriptional activator
MPVLRFYLFGKLKAAYGEQELVGLEGHKLQELLCYLLLYRDRPHPREVLADRLCPDVPGDRARTCLRQVLWRLQHSLDGQLDLAECGLFLVEPDWIQLNPEANWWLDVAEFERAFAVVACVADEELEPQDVRTLESAVSLYRGDLLEGWYQDWCLVERERLQDMYLAMLDALIGHCEATHQYQAGLAYGARKLSYDRAQERTHRRLMRLHYTAGHRTRALRQYQRCADTLEQELGVKPARRTQALYEQIKANNLEATPPAGEYALSELLGRLDGFQADLAEIEHQVRHDVQVAKHSVEP